MKRYVLFPALLALLISGCPRDPDAPELEGAQPCETIRDCAPDAGPVCGMVTNCVDGFCEAEPSLIIECR